MAYQGHTATAVSRPSTIDRLHYVAAKRDTLKRTNALLLARVAELEAALTLLIDVAVPDQDPLVMFASIEQARAALASQDGVK